MEDGLLIQYDHVEICRKELVVLKDVNLNCIQVSLSISSVG